MKIGIAIACHNNRVVLEETLPLIYNKDNFIVLFDDNSSDGTDLLIKRKYPLINYLKGDGFNWWGGSIAKAIDFCLENNCDFVLSLNADVAITQDTIRKLVETSISYDFAIVASVVVDKFDNDKIAWAGSVFKKIHRLIPIYASKYIKKAGRPIKELGSNAYEVDEVHGRGVIFPKEVFEIIGNLDFKSFPHYGGDTDFSFRAKKAGIRLIVDPKCISQVFEENTGLVKNENVTFSKKITQLLNYLFKRKNGEALVVWWKLLKKHLPIYYFIPSYFFIISLNIYRRLTK